MTVERARKTPLIFYRVASGREPVREWRQGLEASERRAIGRDLMRAQWRWPVGMPLCRPLGNGLWEIRTALPTKRTARVLLVEKATGSDKPRPVDPSPACSSSCIESCRTTQYVAVNSGHILTSHGL